MFGSSLKGMIKKLWLGTHGGGLDMYDPDNNRFTHYKHSDDNSATISSNQVHSITEDKNGNLWIGTDGGGLNFFNKESKTFKHFVHSDNKNGLANNNVGAIFQDASENYG